MVDYPGVIACTVFFSGCNLRCGFCQNPDIVNDSEDLKEFSEGEIIEFLKKRANVLDGVCLTGGEPSLYPRLKEFIIDIKSLGDRIKLDTNGLQPKVLKDLYKEGIIDYVAMDIKSSKEKYSEASGIKVDLKKIDESVKIIMNGHIPYEFRSTVVPEFFGEDDINSIGSWLKGAKKFALQQFRSDVHLLDKHFEGRDPYPVDKLEKFKSILMNSMDKVDVRA